MPTESADKKPLQAGRAYCSLESINELNIIFRFCGGRPWSRSSLSKYSLLQHVCNLLWFSVILCYRCLLCSSFSTIRAGQR